MDAGYEILLAGRSNAGKSSALNALTDNPKLARISKTPGRTTEINFFKVNDDDIFVIYDDIDLSFGDKRLKQGGSDAGHKGVRSISQHLGTKNFNRIRLGVGRPKEKEDVSSFVLSNFSKHII